MFSFVGGGALDAPLPTYTTAVIQKICPIEVKFSDGPSKAPAPTVTDVNDHLSQQPKNAVAGATFCLLFPVFHI